MTTDKAKNIIFSIVPSNEEKKFFPRYNYKFYSFPLFPLSNFNWESVKKTPTIHKTS